MQRNLRQLASQGYDLLVIGGGIYGVCVARDAALRGLSVALVERGDFGHATSFNSLKVIHGGLRYLQHLDVRRMRASISERTALMRIAPHLIHPLPFLMPTYGHGLNSKEILRLALLTNDLIGFDRNRTVASEHYLPRGRVISKAACLHHLPDLPRKGVSGGAIWFDCQLDNSERFLLSLLKSAVKAGAEVANYVEATAFLQHQRRITGIQATDQLTGNRFDIRAQMVVNACGPWVQQVLTRLRGAPRRQSAPLSKAMNLLVNRLLIPHYAVGVTSRKAYRDSQALLHKGARLLFIVPWRHYSLIGTAHLPFQGSPQTLQITEEEIEDFITEINAAYAAANLKREDVRCVYSGLLPMHAPHRPARDVSLTKRYGIDDHARSDGIEGLISIIGVKYTESRHVASQVVDLVGKKLGRQLSACRTAVTPGDGGDIDSLQTLQRQVMTAKPLGLHAEILRHLTASYGSTYTRILRYIEAEPGLADIIAPGTPIMKAEVVHALRQEMAMTLSDMVLRRTDLSLYGNLKDHWVQSCAALMAQERGWDQERQQREVEAVLVSGSVARGYHEA